MSTLPGSSTPGFQTMVFHIISFLILLTGYLGTEPGTFRTQSTCSVTEPWENGAIGNKQSFLHLAAMLNKSAALAAA